MFLNILFKTFGCQINEYDTYRIFELLQRVFYCNITTKIEDADVFILNSCAVRDKVEKKVVTTLNEWFPIQKNKAVLIILMGCYTFLSHDILSCINLVVKHKEITLIPTYILDAVDSGFLTGARYIRKYGRGVSAQNGSHLSFFPLLKCTGPSVCVPISDGCNNYCTYCSVPYTRGVEVNRSVESILNDVGYYVQRGVKEIVLLGQNVNAYKTASGVTFSVLVNAIMLVKGVERVRFLTANPNNLTDDLIEIYSNRKLVSHLHLPIQSGSDNVLGRMGRGYTYREYKEKLTSLRQVRPDLVVTTDIIVGFPGESSEDFLKTVSCIEEIGFDFSYCFIYSKRLGTLANDYIDNVPRDVKQERLKKVQDIFLHNGKIISNKLLGTIQSVLFFGCIKGSIYWGKTDNNRTVLVTSVKDISGGMYKVKIINSVYNTFIAEMVD